MDNFKLKLLARCTTPLAIIPSAPVVMSSSTIVRKRKKVLHSPPCSPIHKKPRIDDDVILIDDDDESTLSNEEEIKERDKKILALKSQVAMYQSKVVQIEQMVKTIRLNLIESEKKVSAYDKLNDVCTICLCPIIFEGDECGSIVKLPCSHFIHGNCLNEMCTPKHKKLDQIKNPRNGTGGCVKECLLDCPTCRAVIPSTFDCLPQKGKQVAKNIETFLKKAMADCFVRNSVVPESIRDYCTTIRDAPESIFQSDDYKLFICQTDDCRKSYIGHKMQCGNETTVFECHHCNNTSTWAKHIDGIQCDNCETALQRTGGCSHMTCNCSYQFCYICGGEYVGYMSVRATASSVQSIPFCERPQPNAFNLNGHLKRFGRCLCLERNTLEAAQMGMTAETMLETCLAPPSLGYMEGYGYEKLQMPFV